MLFITVDDLNTSLGSYAHPLVRSPNIDHLAKEGILFSRAYCQYPLCGPSRVSLLSGMRPDSTGVYDNESANFRDIHEDILTLPQLFRQNGYFVARVGKIYHQAVPEGIGQKGPDDPYSWDVTIDPRGQDADEDRIGGKSITRFPALLRLWWLDSKSPAHMMTDGVVAREAIRLLTEHVEKRGSSPFFLAVGFYRPHPPFIAPREYFQLYSSSSIELPPSAGEAPGESPRAALSTWSKKLDFTADEHRRLIRAYFASVSFVDTQIGLVLETLSRLRLLDNTVVVLLSDNGFLLGEHGQWLKRSLFEEAVHVPLIITAPSLQNRGRSCNRTVELLDIYPTLADLCGLGRPDHVEGKSLAPLLKDPELEWARPAFSQVSRRDQEKSFMGRSLRTERWRYTEWDNGRRGKELYDHDTDPFELRDLSRNPAYSEIVTHLNKLLNAGLVDHGEGRSPPRRKSEE